MQEDLYGVWSTQHREGSAAGRDVSVLRGPERCEVANGRRIHDDPKEAKRLDIGLSAAGLS